MSTEYRLLSLPNRVWLDMGKLNGVPYYKFPGTDFYEENYQGMIEGPGNGDHRSRANMWRLAAITNFLYENSGNNILWMTDEEFIDYTLEAEFKEGKSWQTLFTQYGLGDNE